MKKSELKKVLSPIIKECIREILLEESGVLSKVVAEVAQGVRTSQDLDPVISENKVKKNVSDKREKALKETKNKLADAIGKSSYNGVNIFEGTTPMRSDGAVTTSSANEDPSDAGVDISSFVKSSWSKLV